MPFPSFYIPHGGGPCFFMSWDPPDTWEGMRNFLTHLLDPFTNPPRAIVVISAHWEEDRIGVTAQEAPQLLYDYDGFPPETYQLTYPASGDPGLAARISSYLTNAGIPSELRRDRGFDHGVFIPLKLIYPLATIPVIQISLHRSLDPQFHIDLGKALKPLQKEEVLVIGSGMSYHNLRSLFHPTPRAQTMAHAFDHWLTQSLTTSNNRDSDLMTWRDAPFAAEAHPRAEHLIPLMVISGYADEFLCRRLYTEDVMGYPISGYGFYSTKNSGT